MRQYLFVAAVCGVAGLVGCGGGSSGGRGDVEPIQLAYADETLAACTAESPYLQIGAEIDAPSLRLAVDVPAVGSSGDACSDNQQFRFGSGLADITGPSANTSGMGWEDPTQVFNGIHLRQFARAFVIASPCNGKRVAFVSTDTGMMFGAVRLAVLERIAADPELAAAYSPETLMLSATHTHSGPAGYSHYEAFNLFHFGFDQLVLDTIAEGIVDALRIAHQNVLAHPESSPLRMAVGELLNTNINRSLPAFELNPVSERNEFMNSRGEVVTVDKRVVQLNLVRADGSGVGIINWFGVHPTVVGPETTLVSSDNKGYASRLIERIMHDDTPVPMGEDQFVAAFAQKDEGDSSPNIYIAERPHPDPRRGGGTDVYESAAISGTKQAAKALELLKTGEPLTGPVDSRLFHVQMDAVTVTDPYVLASLQHPAEMDADEVRTCLAALGPSFGAGAEDGPGPSVEGVDCGDDADFIQSASNDFMALAEGKIPPEILSTAVLCNLDQQPLLDLGCQAEKPVLFAVGPPLSAEPNVLPMQILRIGNLAVVGLPWEVTTMSARRIQKGVLDVLAAEGIDTVVVAGLVNDYVHYLTTREEYASQQYEGASNVFGPWTLAAVQQETRRLARSLANSEPAPDGPEYVDAMPLLRRTPYIPSDLPGLGTAFGDTVTDVPASAAPGTTVTASFQGGHPRNDLRLNSSYVYVERQQVGGEWEVVATDRDPELWFVWHPSLPSSLPIEVPEVGPSTAEVVWHIPANTPSGSYRLRYVGAAQTLILPKEEIEGISASFHVTAPQAECP